MINKRKKEKKKKEELNERLIYQSVIVPVSITT